MQRLMAAFAKFTLNQQKQFAQLWGINTDAITSKSGNALAMRIYERLQEPMSNRFVWEQLSRDEQVVLYNVIGASSRNWVRTETVQT